MKPDPYSHIRAALNRRVGATVVKALPPIVRARPIGLDKSRRRIILPSYVNHS